MKCVYVYEYTFDAFVVLTEHFRPHNKARAHSKGQRVVLFPVVWAGWLEKEQIYILMYLCVGHFRGAVETVPNKLRQISNSQSSAISHHLAAASRQAPTSCIKTKKGRRCLAGNKKDIRVMNCLLLFTESNRTQPSGEQCKYTKMKLSKWNKLLKCRRFRLRSNNFAGNFIFVVNFA